MTNPCKLPIRGTSPLTLTLYTAYTEISARVGEQGDGMAIDVRGAGAPTSAGLLPRQRCPARGSTASRPTWGQLAREALLLVVLLAAYSAARLLGGNDVGAAFAHAHRVLGVEAWLHLPSELGVQQWLLSSDLLAQAANRYYEFAHLPVTGVALAWLFLRHPGHYLWARRALVSATGSALVVFLLVPVAPPRMLGSLGFVDVGRLFGQSVYGEPTAGGLTNQYAAMPSLHVGWSVLVAVVCLSALHSRWRWLWVAHPVLTTVVVVGTGNHYWLDAAAGAALVTTTLVVTRRRLGRRTAPQRDDRTLDLRQPAATAVPS